MGAKVHSNAGPRVPLSREDVRGDRTGGTPSPGGDAVSAAAGSPNIVAAKGGCHVDALRDALNSKGATGPTPGTEARVSEATEHATLRSDAEVRHIVRKKTMPALAKALPKFALTSNDAACDKAATLTKHALDRLGVKDARIINGHQHALVEVSTREGKTLVIDPTIAQFVRDDAASDARFRKEGFVGTKAELGDLLFKHRRELGLPDDSAVMQTAKLAEDAVAGKYGRIEPKARAQFERDIETCKQRLLAKFHYPEDHPSSDRVDALYKQTHLDPVLRRDYGGTARKALLWYQDGAKGNFMVTRRAQRPDGQMDRWEVDLAPRYRAAFEALENAL